jgi:hypothetical protein
MAVIIPIVTEYAGKGVQRALKEFQSLTSTTDKAAFVLRKALVPGAIAATGAVAILGKGLFEAAKAAAEDQKSQALLARQLQATTGATDAQISAVEQYINKTQLAAGVTDDQLRPALSSLVRATGDTAIAQEQLGLALDIAAGTGKDVESVAIALAKAYNGNFAALTKLGVPLDENITKTKNYQAAQEALAKQFGGASATAANTFDGQLKRLSIAWGELVEQVGYYVLPYLQRFVDAVNKYVVPALGVFIDQLQGGKGVKGAFEIAIASMGDFAPVAIRAMKAATEGVLEFVKTVALAYAGIQTLIGAAQALATRGKAGLPAFSAALAAAGGAVITDQLKARTLAYFDDLESRLGSLSAQASAARNALNPIPDRLDRISAAANALAGGGEEEEGGGAGGGLNRMADRAKKLQERLEAAAKALRDDMANALKIAEERLGAAQQAFDDFASSVTNTITDAMNFEDALEASAEEGGGSFFDELSRQAQRADEFGKLTEELLRRGISKDALNQVLEAGVESGAEIARQLLASADGVLKANTLVERTQAIAEKIGQASAAKFYGAGVANGQEYLRGVMEAIAEAERRIAGAKRPADIKGASAAFSDTMSRLSTPSTTVQNVTINSQSLDPGQAGQVIVDALREYNQRSGYIGLSTTPF